MSHSVTGRRKLAGSAFVRAGIVAVSFITLAGPASEVSAQSPQEREVIAVVERFFQGMLERDTVMMRSTLDPAARLVGVAMREGQSVVRATSMDAFVASVGRAQGEPAHERIYEPEVRIDGNMAQVWTYYTLHIGERFSHCGYDAFQLLRLEDGWKIVNVADSRQTEGCRETGGR